MIEEGVVTKVLIIVPHYWGKAETIDGAWEQVKKESYRNLRELKSGPHGIYVVYDKEDVKSRVDEFGFNITYPEGYPPRRIHAHKLADNS